MQLWDSLCLVLFKSKWLFQWESAKDFRSCCCDHPACRARGWGGTHHPPRSYLGQSSWHCLLDLQQPTERECVGDRPPRSSTGKPEVWGSKPKVCCSFVYRKSDCQIVSMFLYSSTVILSLSVDKFIHQIWSFSIFRCCLSKAIDRTGVLHFFSKSFNKQKKSIDNVCPCCCQNDIPPLFMGKKFWDYIMHLFLF